MRRATIHVSVDMNFRMILARDQPNAKTSQKREWFIDP